MRFPTLRLFWRIVKGSGAHKALTVYGIFFVLIALLIWLVDPAVPTFRASLWYCFVAGTTIGFGDIAAVSPLGRMLTILVSIYSIIMVAIATAVITNFYLEATRIRAGDSAHRFLEKLERLPELSQEELEDLSEQAKRFAKKWSIE